MSVINTDKENKPLAPSEDDLRDIQDFRVAEAFGVNIAFRFRSFIIRYLELVFVLIIAMLVCAVFFIFPYKYAFLNLFYLPVLLAAYILGKQKAFYASLNIILVVVSAFIRPEWFIVSGNMYSMLIMIVIWGGFLVLTSAGIGSLQERLSKGFEETRRLYEELEEKPCYGRNERKG
ncbi:MAG: hypothetical protein C0399_05490 [Syntrophus sp. (in: bacteria)]|nr:hypothetical protein [Syntrophus sp. (in: bacteria)]